MKNDPFSTRGYGEIAQNLCISLKNALKNAVQVPFSSLFTNWGPAICGEKSKNRVFRGRALESDAFFMEISRFFCVFFMKTAEIRCFLEKSQVP
ncbi:MAG: hypothetical protein KBT02_07065 [Treponema sp.]|nr:hypothetical protein [Candidatus Treponema caballi]